jgi:hypothetical protein
MMLFLVANGFLQYGLNQWWPSFYVRSFGLGSGVVGVHVGLAIGIGSAVGLLIGGVLANQLAKRNVRLPLELSAAVTVLVLPAALGSLFAPTEHLSILLVGATALFWSVSNGPVLAAIYSVTLAPMRATAGAVNIFFTSALGFGLGPLIVGVLSDMLLPRFGSGALRYALVVPICFVPVMVYALFAAARALPGDLKAVGALTSS